MAIYFPVLRTKRLTVQLKELSISNSIALNKMPLHLEQASNTAFLRFALTENHDIDNWTVAERTLVICHYLSSLNEDNPNFSVGEKGHYMDYLDGDNDIADIEQIVDLGEFGGDFWQIKHLTGYAAEMIERLTGEVQVISGRFHWIIGAMAAQLVRKTESVEKQFSEEWLLNRMRVIASYSESDFILLLSMFYAGMESLHHLFRIDFDDSGIVIMPKQQGVKLPAARFRATSCLSEFTKTIG